VWQGKKCFYIILDFLFFYPIYIIYTSYYRYKGDTSLTALEMNQRYGLRPEILEQLDSLYLGTLPEAEPGRKDEEEKSCSSNKKKK